MKVFDTSSIAPGQMLALLQKHVPYEQVSTATSPSEVDKETGDDLSAYALKATPKSKTSHPVQVVFHGCPGSGKSHTVKQWSLDVDKVFDLVFHPELAYSDFVGVYRPRPLYRRDDTLVLLNAAGETFHLGEPYITYEFVAGPFLEAYCFAKVNPGHTVAVLIEELSRANASLVFGDMLQLLDRSEDGLESGQSTYSILPKPEVREYLIGQGIDVETGGRMRLPGNLYIWATMNRSDQNARQLDAAFLRRWEKRYLSHAVKSEYGSKLVRTPDADLPWDELRSRINSALLEEAVSEDKLIGPYFLREAALASPERVAENLLGYLWNDVLRARAREFFAPGLSSLADVITAWVSRSQNPFAKVPLSLG